MIFSGKTQVYCIFGYPVEHTFSPGMHNAAFAKIGMNACYVPFAIPPDRLKDAIGAVISLGIRGLNITVPHKEHVLSWLDDLSEEARLIGAVNTIELTPRGLIGHNTDGRGFLRSLREQGGMSPKGKRFLIIGSGGAARAVGFSLALAGASQIVFRDLDTRKAKVLAGDIAVKTGVMSRAIDKTSVASYAANAECLINATPLGLRKNDPLPLEASIISKEHLVCDLVYNPAETALLKMAKKRGGRTLSGLGMLLYQGVIAFEIWTGQKAPVLVMKNALARQMR